MIDSAHTLVLTEYAVELKWLFQHPARGLSSAELALGSKSADTGIAPIRQQFPHFLEPYDFGVQFLNNVRKVIGSILPKAILYASNTTTLFTSFMVPTCTIMPSGSQCARMRFNPVFDRWIPIPSVQASLSQCSLRRFTGLKEQFPNL
jgi:hypothetical protein